MVLEKVSSASAILSAILVRFLPPSAPPIVDLRQGRKERGRGRGRKRKRKEGKGREKEKKRGKRKKKRKEKRRKRERKGKKGKKMEINKRRTGKTK